MFFSTTSAQTVVRRHSGVCACIAVTPGRKRRGLHDPLGRSSPLGRESLLFGLVPL